MEVSIRYVPNEISVIDGKTIAAGSKPALCLFNDQIAHCVLNTDTAVDAIDYPLALVKKGKLVQGYENLDSGIPRYIAHLGSWNKEITPRARELIDYALNPDRKNHPVSQIPASPPKKPALIKTLSQEYDIDPRVLRQFLRAQGLRAPYEDEKKLRTLINRSLSKFLTHDRETK